MNFKILIHEIKEQFRLKTVSKKTFDLQIIPILGANQMEKVSPSIVITCLNLAKKRFNPLYKVYDEKS
jgi:hypothetical protein